MDKNYWTYSIPAEQRFCMIQKCRWLFNIIIIHQKNYKKKWHIKWHTNNSDSHCTTLSRQENFLSPLIQVLNFEIRFTTAGETISVYISWRMANYRVYSISCPELRNAFLITFFWTGYNEHLLHSSSKVKFKKSY